MSDWTPERTEVLTSMWMGGFSAREVADALSAKSPFLRVSRSAVIGKVHRLGLKRPNEETVSLTNRRRSWDARRKDRPERRPRRVKTETKPRPTKIRVVTPDVPSPVQEVAAQQTARPWLTRRSDECAFPVSGKGADTYSCCAKKRDGETYCDAHREVMYTAKAKQNPPSTPYPRRRAA